MQKENKEFAYLHEKRPEQPYFKQNSTTLSIFAIPAAVIAHLLSEKFKIVLTDASDERFCSLRIVHTQSMATLT